LNDLADQNVLLFGNRLDSSPFGQPQFFGVQRVRACMPSRKMAISACPLSFCPIPVGHRQQSIAHFQPFSKVAQWYPCRLV
jgi:hypothetical protein